MDNSNLTETEENPADLVELVISNPPILFHKTQKLIDKIEREVGATFLTYWTSVNGSVSTDDATAVHEILQSLGEQKHIVLFIKSDGGSGMEALRIVHVLRHYAPRITVLVPLDCASAATMIALGADEIQMGPLAYLTAVDTSLTHSLSPVDNYNSLVSVSQDELLRTVALWRKEANANSDNPYKALFEHIHPLVIGAVDRSISLSIKICTEILSYHMDDQKRAEEISLRLNNDYPAHEYPITLREAKRIGLNVKQLPPQVNQLLLELNKTYSEMGQRARTYLDKHHVRDNEITNVMEGRNLQVYYQNGIDRHYRTEERRWVRTNDESYWRKIERVNGRMRKDIFHIR